MQKARPGSPQHPRGGYSPGKNKPYFTPHVDCGDYVIIINAEKVKLTGSKMLDKVIQHYTGHPGGRKGDQSPYPSAQQPGEAPRALHQGNAAQEQTGKRHVQKLFVYAGSEHPHVAPET